MTRRKVHLLQYVDEHDGPVSVCGFGDRDSTTRDPLLVTCRSECAAAARTRLAAEVVELRRQVTR